MAKKRKEWTGAETRLVSEYLASRWPDARTMQRVRVGQIPADLPTAGLAPEEIAMLGVWRRWVDAVIVAPPRVILIEAGILPKPGDVSQLELYLHLFPLTPELHDLAEHEVSGMLLYAVDDPVIRMMARKRGFTVQIFCPPWVGQYLAGLLPRGRRAPLAQ